MATLSDAVDMIGSRKYRRILTFVLPLSPEYRGRSLKVRRTAAGQHLKDGKSTVKWGTIRTYHEPTALHQLAAVLVKMEAEYRGESSTPADADED